VKVLSQLYTNIPDFWSICSTASGKAFKISVLKLSVISLDSRVYEDRKEFSFSLNFGILWGSLVRFYYKKTTKDQKERSPSKCVRKIKKHI